VDDASASAQTNEVTVEVTALSSRGAGVGRVGGKVVFVPLALPGETVRAGIARRRRDYDQAYLIEIITRSPARVQPFCQMYPSCHGCQLQHLAEAEQLPMKAEATGMAGWLTRAGESAEVALHPAPSGIAYRTAARFHVNLSEPLYFGFLDGRRVTHVSSCPVLSPGLNRLLAALSKAASEPVSARRFRKLRITAVRAYSMQAEDAVAAVLCSEENVDDDVRGPLTELLDALRPNLPSLIGFSYVGEGRRAPIHLLESGFDDEWPETRRSLGEGGGGVPVRVNFGAFAQANPPVAAAVYRAAVEWVAPRPGEVGADLYCGTGAIADLLASRGARVFGVELSDIALSHHPREFIGSPGDPPPDSGVTYIHSDAARSLPDIPPLDFIIADPPRDGFTKKARSRLADRRVRRFVIISCDAATLKRDLAELLPAYRVERLAFYDMMPYTADVEILALLRAQE